MWPFPIFWHAFRLPVWFSTQPLMLWSPCLHNWRLASSPGQKAEYCHRLFGPKKGIWQRSSSKSSAVSTECRHWRYSSEMDTPLPHWQILSTNRPRWTPKRQQSTLHVQQRCPPGERIRTTLVQCLCVKLTWCSQGKKCFLTIICRRLYSLQYTTNYDRSGGCCNKCPPRHLRSTGRKGSDNIRGKNSINDDCEFFFHLCSQTFNVLERFTNQNGVSSCTPRSNCWWKSDLVSPHRCSSQTDLSKNRCSATNHAPTNICFSTAISDLSDSPGLWVCCSCVRSIRCLCLGNYVCWRCGEKLFSALRWQTGERILHHFSYTWKSTQ